jgi:hypothetical protein
MAVETPPTCEDGLMQIALELQEKIQEAAGTGVSSDEADGAERWVWVK